jgi:hypothetical protein
LIRHFGFARLVIPAVKKPRRHGTPEGAQDARRSTRAHGCALGEHIVREEEGVSLVTFFAPAKKVTRSRSE